jgi:hypothetical protein
MFVRSLLRSFAPSLATVAMIATISGAVSARAQTPTMPEAAVEIMRLYKDRKGPEAVKLAEEVLKATEARLGPDHLEVANILVLLGGMRLNSDMIERVIEIREKRLGRDDPQVGEALILLVKVSGFGPDSEQLLKRALAIAEKAHGPDHADVSRALVMLHGLYVSAGWHNDAKAIAARLEDLAAKTKAKP